MNYQSVTIAYTYPIEAIVYQSPIAKGTVVYSHGLFSSKDAYKIHKIAPALCSNGYTVLSFSYGYTRYYSHSAPLAISLPQCADELNAVLEFAANTYNPNLHLIGSSMGGAIVLYYVATRPYIFSIKSISLIATPASLSHLVMAIAPGGVNGEYIRAGEYSILSSSLQELSKIDLENLIPRVDVPVCIIHGQRDDVVPVEHAYKIKSYLCVPHAMHIISEGDHALTKDEHTVQIQEYILSWLSLHP